MARIDRRVALQQAQHPASHRVDNERRTGAHRPQRRDIAGDGIVLLGLPADAHNRLAATAGITVHGETRTVGHA
jgi:hypothetical protein